MSERRTRQKPSEVAALRVVESTEAGTVEEILPSGEVLDDRTTSERDAAEIFSGSNLLNIPPVKWLAEGWFPSGGVVSVISEPGKGKSFFSVSTAMEFVRGGEWLGRKLPKFEVLYIAPERPTDIRDRAEGWCIRNEEPLELLEGFHLWKMTTPLDATKPGNYVRIVEQIKRLGAKVVVLDTYAKFTADGQENDNNATERVFRDFIRPICAATEGGLVIVVHHKGKTQGAGARGASSFQGDTDVEITVDFSNGQRSAKVTKINAAQEPPPQFFTIDTVDLPPRLLPNGETAPARSVGVMVEADAKVVAWEEEVRRIVESFESEGGASRRQIQISLGMAEEQIAKTADTWANRLGRSPKHNGLTAQGKLEMVGEGNKNTRYRLGPVWRLAEASRDWEGDEPPKPFAF